MSPPKKRRLTRLVESTIYKDGKLQTIVKYPIGFGAYSTLDKPVNIALETEKLLLLSDGRLLSVKQIIVRLCRMRGPWSIKDLQKQFIDIQRPVNYSTVANALRDLVAFGAVVKANGGYCIVGWDKLT